MRSMKKLLVPFIALSLLVAAPKVSLADGCAPGQPCWEKKAKKKPAPAPMKKEMPAPAKVEPATPPPAAKVEAAPMAAKSAGMSVGAGLNVYFVDCEEPAVAPGVRASYRLPDAPINIRTGVY